jgi:hypothetical protein
MAENDLAASNQSLTASEDFFPEEYGKEPVKVVLPRRSLVEKNRK